MPSTRTRTGPRTISTSCWRSASAQRRPPEVEATAVIAAAGSGERLGAGGPKALVELGGRSLLEWSLDACAGATAVRAVVVAAPPDHVGEVERAVEGTAVSLPVSVVAGGESRSESVAAALEAITTEVAVVHDAARPLADAALFDAVIGELAAQECDCVLAAAPISDTVKEAADHEVQRTLDRTRLWGAQTPQAFRTESLRRALASGGPLAEATDDAMLVERLGGRVLLHPATPENLKVTTPLDLRVATLLLAERDG